MFPRFSRYGLSCGSMPKSTVERVPAVDARRLLMGAQGLLDDPARRATAGTLDRLIRRLGFVQLDTIMAVDRAHHLTLFSRLDDYRPSLLDHLLEKKRALFEHWTHDASAIAIDWYPHWKHRFEQSRGSLHRPGWKKRLGENPTATIDHVRERITKEGPLKSSDFEHDRKGASGAWWGWKPQKTALEYLWRTGELAVAAREKFQKVYDLAERVHPHHHASDAPAREETIETLCAGAMERLVIATHSEVFQYWNGVTPAEARAWCARAEREGRLVRVEVEPARGDGKPKPSFALVDWKQRLRKLSVAPDRMRLLSPFDPVIRDRDRALRLFGFDYRFEAFVPAPKRKYGYYVMPVLEGEHLIARIDPKTHRDADELEIRRIWWEPHVKPTKVRMNRLEEAIARLALQAGVGHYRIEA